MISLIPTHVFSRAFVPLSGFTAFLQALPAEPVTQGLERLGLVGVLCSAVVVLWRSNAQKDATNLALQKEVAAALVATADATKELRGVVAGLYERLAQCPGVTHTSTICSPYNAKNSSSPQ